MCATTRLKVMSDNQSKTIQDMMKQLGGDSDYTALGNAIKDDLDILIDNSPTHMEKLSMFRVFISYIKGDSPTVEDVNLVKHLLPEYLVEYCEEMLKV
jgi:hypothetical protein